jgi:hypothetical protein
MELPEYGAPGLGAGATHRAASRAIAYEIGTRLALSQRTVIPEILPDMSMVPVFMSGRVM